MFGKGLGARFHQSGLAVPVQTSPTRIRLHRFWSEFIDGPL